MKTLLQISCALLITFSLFSCDTKAKFVEQKHSDPRPKNLGFFLNRDFHDSAIMM